MTNTKYFLLAALGAAGVLLLTSDRAKGLRDKVKDKAMKNADKWKNRLSKIGGATTDTVADLKKLLSTEIEGLSDDARRRIETILDGSAKSAAKLKTAATNHAQ